MWTCMCMCVFCFISSIREAIWEFNNSIGFLGMRVEVEFCGCSREHVKIRDGGLCKSEHSACIYRGCIGLESIGKCRFAGISAGKWNMISRVAPAAVRGGERRKSEGAERGEETKQADRFVVASYPYSREDERIRSGAPREYQYVTFNWPSVRSSVTMRAVETDARQLFANQISLRLNSLQTRGDCARRSISMPGSTMNPATRTAPLSLINLITLSQFPRRRCDRPDCRRAIQSCRFSSRPPPSPFPLILFLLAPPCHPRWLRDSRGGNDET